MLTLGMAEHEYLSINLLSMLALVRGDRTRTQVWNDGKGQWWENATGAKAKVAVAIASGVEELACFRLAPAVPAGGGGADTPAGYWWDALAPFIQL